MARVYGATRDVAIRPFHPEHAMRSTVRSRLLLATVAALVLAACQSDELGSPEPTIQRTYNGPSVRLPGFPGLDLSISAANICDESALERDSKGKFLRWQNSVRKNVDVRAAAKDTVLALYQIWHFDAQGKQIAKAECVLPRGDAANVFARDYFTGGSKDNGNRPLITLYSIGMGTSCYWINSQGDVNCGGVICFLGNVHMRAPVNGMSAVQADGTPVETQSVGASGSLLAEWSCSDGGALSMDHNGTVTYFPGGSGGSDDPPTPGGGTCTNPTPGDTNPDGSPVQDELRGIGSSCDTATLNPPADCDSSIDPQCEELNPDPENSCGPHVVSADSSTWEGWAECVQGGPPYMARHQTLVGCPSEAAFATISRDGPAHPSGSWQLQRIGPIKSKSFGGLVRFDVAHYVGTVSIGGVPSAAIVGDVWCQVGIGIFR